MQASFPMRRRQLYAAAALAAVTLGSNAVGQTIQLFPIRSAPLGSPPGTVGDPVTPQFNAGLGCWEVQVNAGVEVDLAVQGSGWGNAAGSPTLGAIQATVRSASYNNSVGATLRPKGWPGSPTDGAYQADKSCLMGGNGNPCTPPFDGTCDGGSNGICLHNPDWIMPPCTAHKTAIATPTLNYAWAVAVQVDCNIDVGATGSFGGLILEVPNGAAGTYRIELDADPNNTFMNTAQGVIQGLTITPACITVLGNNEPGKCCSNIGPNVVCDDVTPQVCSTRPEPRSFAAGETCGPCGCATCFSDAQCNDGDDCTVDTCDECGQCVNTPNCPEMRFYPKRSAALGSPPGTVGNPVTPDFNSDLGCWELQVTPGREVDIDVQAFRWSSAPGSPNLLALQATSASDVFSNGTGSDLTPKGWPGQIIGQGIYQAIRRCESGGDLSPCVSPFDVSCDGGDNGECVAASNYVMPECAAAISATGAFGGTLTWAAAVQVDCNVDDGEIKTLGGLILNVPHDAHGTYMIDFDQDLNNSFMNFGQGTSPTILTPACITVLPLTMNRYLKFVPHESVPVAYKLDMVSSLFHPDAFVSGWVGAPNAAGISFLEPAPVTREWTESVIYVTGCEITPVADFELRASADDGATFLPPISLQTTRQPIQSRWWGDLVGDFNGTVWTPPNGVTNIVDALAIHKTWQQYPNAPHLSRTDVAPQVLNRVVNAEDLFFVLQAFKGEPYPFGCPDDPCEDNMFEPCP